MSMLSNNRLKVDPEFRDKVTRYLDRFASAPELSIEDIAGRVARICSTFANVIDPPLLCDENKSVEHRTYGVQSYDNREIKIHHFKTTPVTGNDEGTKLPTLLPAVLHIHGGGMIMGSVLESKPTIDAFVLASGVQFFSVDYRLAPKYPHPTPTEDCFAALRWLTDHHRDFSIDPSRVAVMGDSAGGGIAAAIAIMARDRGVRPPLAKQILIYPMLDDRTVVPDKLLASQALWSYNDNAAGWKALLGEQFGTDEVSPYAAPARVESVRDLPPSYIDVGGLDIFRDEDLYYATRLVNAGVDVEFHLYRGVPHAFEAICPEAKTTQQAIENRLRALRSF